jgi:hypothetical protein
MAAEEAEFHDFYKYTPSKVAAAVFIVLFAISSIVHLLQLLRNRVWFFIPMFLGGLCQWFPIKLDWSIPTDFPVKSKS